MNEIQCVALLFGKPMLTGSRLVDCSLGSNIFLPNDY